MNPRFHVHKESAMCRWLAYTGNPVSLETMLFHARHSLIDQSLHSRFGATTTNGDGFGLGWYQHPRDMPFRYRSIQPAWHDHNLRELSRAVSAPMFLAHVRAATHTPVQETNCHPFRHRRWMFMHNGMIEDFPWYGAICSWPSIRSSSPRWKARRTRRPCSFWP
jgi:glutamine amidotransferase